MWVWIQSYNQSDQLEGHCNLLLHESIRDRGHYLTGVLCPGHGKSLVSDLPVLLVGVSVYSHLEGGHGGDDASPCGVGVAAIASLVLIMS